MKYSIIMPFCYKRSFKKTLESFRSLYSGRNDYEVVVVEDEKNDYPIDEIIKEFPDINIKHLVLKGSTEIFESSHHYNYGVKNSTGEIIILTNPECYHRTDVLGGLDNSFSRGVYIVCSCLAVYEDGREMMWYQHSGYNNRMLHFCSAIYRSDYEKIGGFDEEFGKGSSYNDDDFLRTVKKFGIMAIARDDLSVCHVEHARGHQRLDLIEKNRTYYTEKWCGMPW